MVQRNRYPPTIMSTPPPFCFISYSRSDSKLAHEIQSRLESYRYPASLVQADRRPADRHRLRPVFLDTSDLPTSSAEFWNDICGRIDQSKFLLVICSKAAAASKYVDMEIEHFIGADEGRLEKLLLVVADGDINLTSPAHGDLPPAILRRWDRLAGRNHPLMLPKDGENVTSMKTRCLMQVISFLLGVEWTVLYNRYLIERRRALQRAALAGLAVLSAVVVSLSWALWKERELTTFERKVFPYSLVVGYVDNFLSPLITALEEGPDEPLIIIVLPASYEELDHNKRVAFYQQAAGEAGYRAELTKVKTRLPRGAETAVIIPTPPGHEARGVRLYVDFASTVAAFRHVIEYKKRNPAYENASENEMLLEYVDEFERSVLEELRGDGSGPDQSGRVIFVRSPEEAMRVLNS